MTLTKIQKNKKEFEKTRTKIIQELNKIEKTFGSELFKKACYRKLLVDRQKKSVKLLIKEKEQELIRLRKGNPV